MESVVLAGDEAAIDQLIAEEPGNVAALIRKADIRAGAGDERVATAFYKAALKAAAQGNVPSSLSGDLERAQAACQRATNRFVDYLEERLANAGFAPGKRPPRFQESIDILMGRRRPEMGIQRPLTYFYPGLPQRRYYERHEFDWVPALEQQAEVIRKEITALAANDGRFQPYIYSDPSKPPRADLGMADNPDWSALMLWESGSPVAQNLEQFPSTWAALEQLDLVYMPGRAPSVMFSKLKAGARIPPHTGLFNVRLVCHLALVIPDGCMFTVGGENRQWHEGQLLMFDDSIVHEAVNGSSQDRIVLIFEMWRPELSIEERQVITTIFDAISSYSS
jgi:aspartyl/asparaginyl beta-hydroxylase (cupin superfamily)